MKTNQSITCKNCNNLFEGHYCNNCGQPGNTHRITWHEMSHYLTHAFFHTDKGFFYTIKELLLRPGYTIKDYIDGKRVKHFNPFLFLIIIGGITTYLFATLHLKLPNEEIDLEKIEHLSSTIAHKYLAFTGTFFIIILTLTDYLFHPKRGYLIPEIITSNTYQVVMILLFSLLMLPLLLLENYLLKLGVNIDVRIFLKAIVFIYLFFTRYQLYDAKGNNFVTIKISAQVILILLINNYAYAKFMAYLLSEYAE
jgi:hypothetical protein